MILKDFIKPIIVLAVICILISGALAIVNNITEPVITAAALERAYSARREILPQADGFEALDYETGMPRSITEIFRSINDTGYLFMISTMAYGRDPMVIICGIDPEGRIIRASVLSHSETQGLGTPVFEEAHAGQFWGKNRAGIEDIAAISGATITSNAFKNAMRDALIAFEILRTQRSGESE